MVASVWDFWHVHRSWCMQLYLRAVWTLLVGLHGKLTLGEKSLATLAIQTHISTAPSFSVRCFTNWAIPTPEQLCVSGWTQPQIHIHRHTGEHSHRYTYTDTQVNTATDIHTQTQRQLHTCRSWPRWGQVCFGTDKFGGQPWWHCTQRTGRCHQHAQSACHTLGLWKLQ